MRVAWFAANALQVSQDGYVDPSGRVRYIAADGTIYPVDSETGQIVYPMLQAGFANCSCSGPWVAVGSPLPHPREAFQVVGEPRTYVRGDQQGSVFTPVCSVLQWDGGCTQSSEGVFALDGATLGSPQVISGLSFVGPLHLETR